MRSTTQRFLSKTNLLSLLWSQRYLHNPPTDRDHPLPEGTVAKAAVCPNGVPTRHRFAPLLDALEDLFAAFAFPSTGGHYQHAQDQAQRIDGGKSLASFDHLAGIKAHRFLNPGSTFHTLTIERCFRGTGMPPVLDPDAMA